MRWRLRNLWWLLPSLVSSAFAATNDEELWLDVVINGEPAQQTVLLLRQSDGHVLVKDADLRHWRLAFPSDAAVDHLGAPYYPLDGLAGLTYQVDEASQTLKIDAPARLFDKAEIRAGSRGYEAPTAPPPGGFLNYDVFASRDELSSTASGLLEADAFGKWGAGVMRFLHTNSGELTRSVRLDSTWTYDRPESASSFRLGDAITGSSRLWGGAVRFGGIQWASNFSTRPGLVTFPLPSVAGEATLPSTVDLYVNGALRLQHDLPSGPFDIDDIPVVTGDGDIRVVVRDLLGREQVLSQSYYASPRLLKPGLHDFSYEIGATRRNFGLTSDDYGRPLAVGTHRMGFTNTFTGEVHGEILEDQQTLSLASSVLLPFGVLTTAIGGSHSEQGDGGLATLGVERRMRRFGFGGNAQYATRSFTHVGLVEGLSAPQWASQMFVTLGSTSFTRTEQRFRDRPSIAITSARQNVRLGQLGFLSLSALRIAGEQRDTIVDLTFAVSLGERTSSSFSVTSQGNSTRALMQVQKNAPAGSGWGYRMRAGAGESNDLGAAVSAQNDVGTYLVDAERNAGGSEVQASASGSFALMAGQVFPSRRIDSSFAVARVPDRADVRVYSDNQLVGRTNDEGYMLLPGLRAYQNNLIRIEQADLPLDVAIGTTQLNAVPFYRSGLLLSFPVTSPHGALLSVVLADGQPLPPGAVLEGQFPSALNGEIYVTGLEENNSLRIEYRGQSCVISVPYKITDDPLPHLGPFVCAGVKL